MQCLHLIKILTFSTNFFVGAAIGDCTTDAFSITSLGGGGTPTICGFNTGQHSKMVF